MALDSMQEIFDKIQAGRKPFWQVVRDTDVEERQVTADASFEKMHATWRAMVESVDTYRADRRSVSGLVGGDAQRMWDYAAQQETLCGPYLQEVIATALCVAESNACMHRIVAAPTAGACGVLPAVLLPLCKYDELAQHQLLEALYVAAGIGAVIAFRVLPAVLVPLYRRGTVDEEAIVRALYVAAGIGAVVGYRASISGASGGCQAEVGTAAAMAAGALVDLRGGGPEQIGHAVAMALKNLMGLVCDPVAGLVEVPCVKRNVIGAVNAVSAADMALAGIESRVPVDQVIDCMGDVGRRLPVELRETALGGLAATPFGQSVKAKREERRSQEQEL